MIIRLHDNDKLTDFYPLTLTRPIGNLRMGIFTNDERWKKLLPQCEIAWSSELVSGKFVDSLAGTLVNACVIPTIKLAKDVLNLGPDSTLMAGEEWVATNGSGEVIVQYSGSNLLLISERWHLYQMNDEVLRSDFELVCSLGISRQLSASNTLIGDPNQIFLEDGATVEAAILNTSTGPIYIGKNAEIMEGSIVRGPLAMCNNSTLKLGAKIYGATTLGPHCKVGGEVNNSILFGYSNKGHDGFLGNSLIGEWCNLGADTNTSNLKNNYGMVKTHSYRSNRLVDTGTQFMGLTMGDHSKCGINTMFNTAAVVGVSSNVFGAEFPPKFIGSFQWGIDGERYDFDRAMSSANNMMVRRNESLSADEIATLKKISDS